MRWSTLAFLAFIPQVACAQSFLGWGISSRTTCPYSTGASDGCSGAPTTGLSGASVQDTNFFTGYTGQNYGVTRPAWNVAGVEYVVGIPGGTTLKSAETASGSYPTGCTYNGSTKHITCNTSGTILWDGWDFRTSLGECIGMVFGGGITSGTITIRNSRWVNSASGGCEGNGGAMINMFASTGVTSTLIEQNYFDGQSENVAITHTSSWMIAPPTSVGGTLTVQYNVFLDIAGRALQTKNSGNTAFKFNYIEGFKGRTAHGEFAIVSPGNGRTMALHTVGYNVFYQPGTIINPNVTALNQTSVSVDTATITTFNVNNNTQVARLQTLSNNIQVAANNAVSAGNAITFTPTVGSPTVITFTSGAPGANQIQIGASASLTASNILAFLQASVDPNIAHYTYSLSTDSNLVVWFQGDATTMAITENSPGLGTSRASTGFLSSIGDFTFTTINWTSNYLDPAGSLFCIGNSGGQTVGTENFTTNVNLLDGSAVDATHCFGQTH